MGYNRGTQNSKKSYHSQNSVENLKKQEGLWKRLVHHHSKSCNKSGHNCKLTRITNKCRRIRDKFSSDKIEENENIKEGPKLLLNLYSNDNTINFENSIISKEKKFEIIDLINNNNSSPIRMSRFTSKDRIFNTEGEFVSKTYSCPPRSFSTLNSKQTRYKTVIKKDVPIQIRNNNIDHSKENIVPKSYTSYKQRSLTVGRRNSNINFKHKDKTITNLHNKKISKLPPIKKNAQPRRKITPTTPPLKPIQCSTQAWKLLDDYDKYVKEKEKALNLQDSKKSLRGKQDDTFF